MEDSCTEKPPRDTAFSPQTIQNSGLLCKGIELPDVAPDAAINIFVESDLDEADVSGGGKECPDALCRVVAALMSQHMAYVTPATMIIPGFTLLEISKCNVF